MELSSIFNIPLIHVGKAVEAVKGASINGFPITADIEKISIGKYKVTVEVPESASLEDILEMGISMGIAVGASFH